MFSLLRFIIWLAGVIVVSHFILGYFGYEINQDYFAQSKLKCQELITQCQKNLVHQGVDNVKCDYQCVDPHLIISKKVSQ
jgi:hypothetical protein